MVETFQDNDKGFLDWYRDNPRGFVFNFFGGNNPSEQKLHRADCYSLWGQNGANTTYTKVCTTSLEEAQQEAAKLTESPEGWTYCKICEGRGHFKKT